MKYFVRLSLAAAVTGAVLTSCGGGESTQTNKEAYDYERTDSLPEDYLRHLGNIRVTVEETNDMYHLMFGEGNSYNKSALNSGSKAGSYSNTKQQAFNLGVFSSDLSYAVAYEQSQDVIEYMKAMMTLSEKLGIQKAFNQEEMEKLTDAADTATDKSILLTRVYRHAEDQLHSDDRAQLVTMMVTGGWLEGLYIATSTLKDKKEGGKVILEFWDHAFTYNSVVKMLNVFAGNNEDVADLRNSLKEISPELTTILKDRNGVTMEHVQQLHVKLEALRKKYI